MATRMRVGRKRILDERELSPVARRVRAWRERHGPGVEGRSTRAGALKVLRVYVSRGLVRRPGDGCQYRDKNSDDGCTCGKKEAQPYWLDSSRRPREVAAWLCDEHRDSVPGLR